MNYVPVAELAVIESVILLLSGGHTEYEVVVTAQISTKASFSLTKYSVCSSVTFTPASV